MPHNRDEDIAIPKLYSTPRDYKKVLRDLPDTYVTLDQIVKQTLIDLGENTEHKYMKFLQWAIRGIKEFNYDLLNEPKTEIFSLNDDHTIDLPDDYINWSKVGIIRHGKIFTLQQNSSFAFPRAVDDCGKSIHDITSVTCLAAEQTQKVTGPWTIFFNYRNGRNLGNLFGLGGGFNPFGYFRVDKEKHQMAFTSEVPNGDLVLEYIAMNVNPDGSAKVHLFVEESLIAFVHWKRVQQRKDIPQIEKARARHDYFEERRRARSRLNNFSLEDWLKAGRKGYSLSPKF